MTDIFTKHKYNKFYHVYDNLDEEDPIFPIYEAISYILEDIEDYNPQFDDIFRELGDINDRLDELEGQVV